MPPVVIIADRRDSGQTLAAVLKERLGITWSQARRVVESRNVRVSGQIVADSTFRVKAGKRISVPPGVVEAKPKSAILETPKVKVKKKKEDPNAEPPRVKKLVKSAAKIERIVPRVPHDPSIPVPEILYSDDTVVVVIKPAGLTTNRDEDEAEEFGEGKRFLPATLADLLPMMLGLPDKPVFAVHRLDRDTSGILVFARTNAAAKDLMEQFRKHTTERRYTALVRGVPKNGRIESLLVRNRGDGRRGSASEPDADGKKAVTFAKVKEAFGEYSLVECRLETGRTHQVRIHLGERGTPLCGEKIYDRPLNGKPFPDGSGATRPMLHAAVLGFTHPETGEVMTWETPPPKDFAELLKTWRATVAPVDSPD